MEIITVVVIIGIMATFAIPNYTISIERAHRKDATQNLIAVHTANEIYQANEGSYWPTSGGWNDLAAINTNLRLSIIDNGSEYRCRKTGPNYNCQACRPQCTGHRFTVAVNQNPISSTNPSCTNGAASCP